MGVIMIIIDGAESSDYKFCKNINKIKKIGSFGKINNTPKGMETSSLTCIMNILGVPKKNIPLGRAYLEALSINADINDNDLIFRCNNITIRDDKLVSSCGNNYKKIDTNFNDNDFKLINMGSYKNLFIIRNSSKYMDSIITYPPHENIGKPIIDILPKCKNKDIERNLQSLICKYNLYPWGQSIKEHIPNFYEIHNKKGAIVCKTEIVRGIGAAMDMYCPTIAESTADIDTNLIEKAKITLELSLKYDFVLLHINGADESAHRRNQKEKIDFIEKVDKEVIEYLSKNIKKDTALIVTSDHGTSSKSGKHVEGLVNYYILNKNEDAKLWLKQK